MYTKSINDKVALKPSLSLIENPIFYLYLVPGIRKAFYLLFLNYLSLKQYVLART